MINKEQFDSVLKQTTAYIETVEKVLYELQIQLREELHGRGYNVINYDYTKAFLSELCNKIIPIEYSIGMIHAQFSDMLFIIQRTPQLRAEYKEQTETEQPKKTKEEEIFQLLQKLTKDDIAKLKDYL